MKFSAPAGAVAAAFAVAALAGCSYVNPITTKQDYSASDGTHVEVGVVDGLNIMVLASAEGGPATMTGTLHNGSDEDVTVQISFDGESATDVPVDAGEYVQLGPVDGQVEVSGTAPVMPGLVAPTAFVSDVDGVFTADVPVLDGTLPEYQSTLDAIG